tara:strand:- start:780 stop:971 length:192 start_codon:yes stop_codon:yes gene_type:complete
MTMLKITPDEPKQSLQFSINKVEYHFENGTHTIKNNEGAQATKVGDVLLTTAEVKAWVGSEWG